MFWYVLFTYVGVVFSIINLLYNKYSDMSLKKILLWFIALLALFAFEDIIRRNFHRE